MRVDEWDLIWRLGLALALSASIGLDRELRQQSAGLRTYTLVGIGSALFMLISKYGFADVLRPGNGVILDPSRVAGLPWSASASCRLPASPRVRPGTPACGWRGPDRAGVGRREA